MKNKLKNFFAKKLRTNPDAAGSLLVRGINVEINNLRTALGISEERGNELQDIIKESWMNTPDTVSAAVKFSEQCVHANELFYCSYIIGAKVEAMQNNPLKGLLEKMTGGD